jgi:hypothetical protein
MREDLLRHLDERVAEAKERPWDGECWGKILAVINMICHQEECSLDVVMMSQTVHLMDLHREAKSKLTRGESVNVGEASAEGLSSGVLGSDR